MPENSIAKYSLEYALRRICSDPTFADVQFSFPDSDQLVYGSRCLLMARSDVFRAMLSNGMIESQQKTIVLHEVEPLVMQELVRTMHTDEFPDDEFMSKYGPLFLSAAMRYQVRTIIGLTEMYFISQLANHNVIGMLQFAHDIDSVFIKEKCLKYIAVHASDIMQLKEFQEIDDDLMIDMKAALKMFEKGSIFSKGSCTPKDAKNVGCGIC
jgi:hypothetical protein